MAMSRSKGSRSWVLELLEGGCRLAAAVRAPIGARGEGGIVRVRDRIEFVHAPVLQRVGPIGLEIGNQRAPAGHVGVDIAVDRFQAVDHGGKDASDRGRSQAGETAAGRSIRDAIAPGPGWPYMRAEHEA